MMTAARAIPYTRDWLVMSVRNTLLIGVCYVVAHTALDYVSFVDPYQGLPITPWSPGAGLALAWVLLSGARTAPFIVVAPVLAGLLTRGGLHPPLVHLFDGILIGGSYLAVGLVARRRFDLRLQSFNDILKLMLTMLAAATLAAAGYVGALWSSGLIANEQIVAGLLRFMIGDVIGMLVVTPLPLLLATRRHWPLRAWEILVAAGMIVLALLAIFALPHASEYQLFYLLFVPLLWSTLRSGLLGAAVALIAIQIGVILALHTRDGAAVDIASFQALMISLAGTGLVFGSLVAQQEEAAKRLRHQQQALDRTLRLRSAGEVATSIAHEVNQPITSIKTFAGIARDALDAGRATAARDAVAKIRSECDRASSIIAATRSLLRQQSANRRPVDMTQILASVGEMLRDRLTAGGIKYVARVHDDVGTPIVDPIQLQQALYNLVDNSIDAITGKETPGTIIVEVGSPNADTIEITVHDTGPGFTGSLVEGQPIPLVTTKPDGMGLGLSIARTFAEFHGGGLSIVDDPSGTIVKLRMTREAT